MSYDPDRIERERERERERKKERTQFDPVTIEMYLARIRRDSLAIDRGEPPVFRRAEVETRLRKETDYDSGLILSR